MIVISGQEIGGNHFNNTISHEEKFVESESSLPSEYCKRWIQMLNNGKQL